MAGYVIHLAVANEYLRKFEGDIKNKEEFINGVIYPDQTKIKGETHYSPYYSSDVDLYEFVLDKKEELDTDFNKGYFLHLLTDYLFYNKYFRLPVDIDTAPGLYHDYDILNDEIIEKYGVIIPDIIKDDCHSNKGDLVYLDREKLDECIEECSSYKISEIENTILEIRDQYMVFNLSRKMKKRYAGAKGLRIIDEKEIVIDDVNDDFVKGKLSLMKIIKTNNHWAVERKNGYKETILDSGYYWLEVYPLDKTYVYTGIFDNNKRLIEVYIDITKFNGVDGNIPFMVDLYLDVVYTHNFDTYILDEDELKDGLDNNVITQEDFDNAYKSLHEVLDKFKTEEDLKVLYKRFDGYLDYMLNK